MAFAALAVAQHAGLAFGGRGRQRRLGLRFDHRQRVALGAVVALRVPRTVAVEAGSVVTLRTVVAGAVVIAGAVVAGPVIARRLAVTLGVPGPIVARLLAVALPISGPVVAPRPVTAALGKSVV